MCAFHVPTFGYYLQTQTTEVGGTMDRRAIMFDCAPTQYVIEHCGTEMSMRPSIC